MLAITSFKPDYVAAARARIKRQLGMYDALAKGTKTAELQALEPAFFDSMVLGLELAFVHRLRKAEGKDGNALNEVRMLATSLLEHDGMLTADSGIKYDPAKSVTGLAIGKKIALDRKVFERLAEAFLAEIAAKYP